MTVRPARRLRCTAALAGVLLLAAGVAGCGRGSPAKASPGARSSYDAALHAQLPQQVQARGTLVVATDASYAPASFFGPDGRTILGFEPDLAAAVGRVLGVRMRFLNADFDTILTDLAAHKVDLAWSAVTDNAAREKTADFVDYFSAGTSIVVRRGNPQGIADLRDLCGKVVAVEQGTVQVELVARKQQNCSTGRIELRTFKTNADALLQLRTGRASAVLNDYPPAVYLSTGSRTRGIYQLASNTQYEPGVYGVAVARDQPLLRDALHAALGKVIASGEYAEVLRHWQVSAGAVPAASRNASSTPGG